MALANAFYAIIFTSAIAGSTRGQPRKPRNWEPAQTPEAAVRTLVEAETIGDAKGFVSQLGDDSKALFDIGIASMALQKALESRFGKKKAAALGASPPESKHYAGCVLQVRRAVPVGEKTLELTVWVRHKPPALIDEETWHVTWDGKGWKIRLPDKGIVRRAVRNDSGKQVTVNMILTKRPSKKERAQAIKEFNSLKRSIEQLTADVKSGRFKTFDDFVQAYESAREKAFGK